MGVILFSDIRLKAYGINKLSSDTNTYVHEIWLLQMTTHYLDNCPHIMKSTDDIKFVLWMFTLLTMLYSRFITQNCVLFFHAV